MHIMDYPLSTQHLIHLHHLELSSDMVLSITLLYALTFGTLRCTSHWEYQNTIPQMFSSLVIFSLCKFFFFFCLSFSVKLT